MPCPRSEGKIKNRDLNIVTRGTSERIRAGIWITALCLLPASRVWAQAEPGATPPPPPPPASGTAPTATAAGAAQAEAQAVLIQINDLGVLRALAPLKLTRDQIDTLIAVTRALYVEAEKRRGQDAEALRALGPDARRYFEAGLRGEEIPAEIDERAGKVFKDIETRNAAAKRNATGRLLIVLKEDFTPAQKAHVEAASVKVFGGKRVPKEYAQDPSRAPREVVQDLALAAFAERVLLNDRIVEVLTRLRAASATAAASSPAPAATP